MFYSIDICCKNLHLGLFAIVCMFWLNSFPDCSTCILQVFDCFHVYYSLCLLAPWSMLQVIKDWRYSSLVSRLLWGRTRAWEQG